MAKLLFYLSFLFCVCAFAQSQNNGIDIDTTSIAYRQDLSNLYNDRTQTTIQFLAKNLDRTIRKDVLNIYEEKNIDFKKKIDKGLFIEHQLYTPIIDSVFNKIKHSNPSQDLSKIKILLAISESKNAYNIGENIVVLNLPLLYELENEFQIASVLSHEIAHQTLNHVQNSIINQTKIDNSEDTKAKTKKILNQRFNQNQYATNLLKIMLYQNRDASRKYEHQADSLGFIYFKNAFPGKEAVPLRTLKILKDLDEEKDLFEIEDYRSLLNKSTLAFNYNWFASELSGYNYQKISKIWDVDSLRTHPDCEVRIEFLKKKFSIKDEDIAPKWVNFNQSKKVVTKEMIFGLYFLEMYGVSLYKALIAYKDDENESYYRTMIYQNLIKIQKARANYTLNRYLETENPVFSDSYNRFLCFCRNIRKSELIELIEYFK
jgi:Zn-dependent protease with chaperone function